AALASGAAAVAGGVVVRTAGGAPPVAAATAVAAAAFAFAITRLGARAVDATTVARHLDRALPDLEESTTLLLADEASLEPVARLQRQRIAARLAAHAVLPPLPHATWRRSVIAAGALGGVALLAGVAAATGVARRARDAMPARARVPAVRDARIRIEPPAYLGEAPRDARGLDVVVAEGSRVTWRLGVDGAIGAARVIAGDDTLAVTGDSATVIATQPALWELRAPGATLAPALAGVHRLLVIPDSAPVVALLEPTERTEVLPGDPRRVAVRVLVDDDHAVARAELVLTITTGKGEAVKFREQRVPLAPGASRDRARTWAATLDLDALGMRPGDELYFHASALDRRAPVPNEGRSETAWVVLPDTAALKGSDFGGIKVDRMPAFFRSQRQIIIDIEKLLADRPAIERGEFESRSAGIGYDQSLLRVRYGQLVGDETAGGGGASVVAEARRRLRAVTGDSATADDDAKDGDGHFDGDGHDHAAPPPAFDRPAADPMAEFAHRHDTEENATLLSAEVKATLKSALGEMWEAEKRLRTYDPRGALPFAYRALLFLKQVQQSQRVYVQRVGFEPPPLEIERIRLTGELGKVDPAREARTVAAADSLAAIRAALVLLGGDAPPAQEARPLLEQAGRQLATRAIEAPGRHLETLEALRRAIDDPACAACRARAHAGLYAALPRPVVTPAPRTPSAPLHRAYLDALAGGR
ncbi:MAG: DUF4175 family protein, partial [Gemmatimonadales bacterium]|nr:DUF4175 family protein [Gemmatimonadales bacterium]